jgi:hypothetical protein
VRILANIKAPPLTCVSQRVLALGICIGLSLIASHTTRAQCKNVIQDGDFETQRLASVSKPWAAEGAAGIDIQKGLSHHGNNNAWIRNTNGWNAIRQTVDLDAGVTYTLKVFVRTSANVHTGSLGFRDDRQTPVSELKFGPLPGYQELRVQFRPTRTGSYNVFAAFWAINQDSWVQLDNVRLEYPCQEFIQSAAATAAP